MTTKPTVRKADTTIVAVHTCFNGCPLWDGYCKHPAWPEGASALTTGPDGFPVACPLRNAVTLLCRAGDDT